MKINKNDLDRLINNGMIIDNRHKTLPLTILNYSKIAQFEKNWDDLTLQCRGLVIDDDYNVVTRPFRKFFNMEELKANEIPREEYDIYKKMDGSLGILFFYADNWHMATRGSFTSVQAMEGLRILQKKYANLNDKLDIEVTYLFEIIYPENRIVVDYGGMEDLVLLGAVHTESGQEIALENINIGFPKTERIEIKDFKTLKDLNIKNEEGFVVRFKPSNFRMKIKFEDYVSLHAIVTEFSNKKVWEALRDHVDLALLLENVPDEFYDKVKIVKDELEKGYMIIEQTAKEAKIVVSQMSTRKEMALYLLEHHKEIMSVVFSMLDSKNYESIIWKMLEPVEFKKI
jgi:RNA ligase